MFTRRARCRAYERRDGGPWGCQRDPRRLAANHRGEQRVTTDSPERAEAYLPRSPRGRKAYASAIRHIDRMEVATVSCHTGRRNREPLRFIRLRYLHEYKSAGGVEIVFSRIVDDANQ